MDNASKSAAQCPVLHEDNYAEWSMRAQFALMVLGLWSTVEPLKTAAGPSGTKTRAKTAAAAAPAEAAAADDAGIADGQHAAEVADSKARGFIGSHVAVHLLRLVMGCSTAREAWQKLEARFRSISAQRISMLLGQLGTIKPDAGETVAMFANRLRELFMELEFCSCEQVETTQVLTMLSGLERAGRQTSAAEAIRNVKPLPSFEDAVIQLSDEERRMKQIAAAASDAGQGAAASRPLALEGRALVAGGRGGPGRGRQGQGSSTGGFKCWWCDEVGHRRDQCHQWLALTSEERARSSGSKVAKALTAMTVKNQDIDEGMFFTSNIKERDNKKREFYGEIHA